MDVKPLKVFWSWQDDLPAKTNRRFVQSALAQALDAVAGELNLAESDRPELDHDTKDVPGWTEIFNTILQKIDESSAFVADVTPIATSAGGKLAPNPNVVLELGYALGALGKDPIILVANSAYIKKAEQLPFDMRHRRGPIFFDLPEGADKASIERAKRQLVADLTGALKTNLAAVLQQRHATIEFARVSAKEGDPSSWLSDPEQVEHRDFFGDAGRRRWDVVRGGARSYLKIVPSGWGTPPTRENVRKLKDKIWPMGRFQNGDGGANEQGVVYVGMTSGRAASIHTATQWFQQTGELWTFDGSIAGLDVGRDDYLATTLLVQQWIKSLGLYLEFFHSLHAIGPFRVEAGVAGLANTTWPGRFASERVEAVDSNAVHTRTSGAWSQREIIEFTAEAFNRVCDAFDKPHVAPVDLAAQAGFAYPA